MQIKSWKATISACQKCKMSQRTFSTHNPIDNNKNKKEYTVNSLTQVDLALKKASKAYNLLGQKSNHEIQAFLRLVKRNIEELEEQLCSIYIAETGLEKSRFETELKRTLYQLDHFANHITDRTYLESLERKDRSNGKVLIKKKFGIGPVLVVGAGNFPLAYSTIGGDSVAALASKNPVILKAHPFHVGTSTLVASAVLKAQKTLDFPEGTFSHIIDEGHELATYIAGHSSIKAIGFTGSQKGGEAFIKLAQNRKEPIPVFAEMGSVNPVVILDSPLKSNSETIAENIANSVCTDSGQFCTKPGMLFLPRKEESSAFLDLLKDKIIDYKDQPMLHPIVQSNFEMKTSKIAEIGGKTYFYQQKENSRKDTHFPKKSIFIGSIKDLTKHTFLQEEVFGPHLSVFYFDDHISLIDVLNNLKGQLTFSVFGSKEKDGTILEDLLNIGSLKSGRVIHNDLPTGVEVCAAMQHGGPYPASSDSRFTAVGTDSITRFQRSVTFQNYDI